MIASVSDSPDQLRSQLAEQLAAKLDTLREHCRRLDPADWQAADVESVQQLLHSVATSAGASGMQSLANAARALETRFAALLLTKTTLSATVCLSVGADLDQLIKLAHISLESGVPNLKQPQPGLSSPMIYLLDDGFAQAAHLSRALQNDGYRVRIFADPAEFRASCGAADTERPAAVLMDMTFPDGDDTGASLLAELRARHARCPPVICISARDDLPARLAAFRAGASRYLVKPVDTGHLIDLLDDLSGRQPAQPYRVLMVDDDPFLLEVQASILRSSGMEVATLVQPLQIMEVLHDFTPDVVVLDVYMPGASGPELAAILREREEQMHLPILFLSAETDMTQQLLALNLGGDDFLVKPVQPDHLVEAVTARARRARQNAAIRHRLKTSLYEREREHQTLNQHAIVSMADRAGIITYTNDKFCEASGYSREELMGQNHRILKSGIHPQEFYQDLWRTIASGKVWQGEVCNRRKDGSLYWVESTITPFLDDASDGRPYQYVSIRIDITHRKMAELALKESESRFRETLNQAPALIWVADTENKGTWYNHRWLEYTGRSMEQELGFGWIEGMHPDDRERCATFCQAAFDTTQKFEMEFRLRRADGSYGWIVDTGIPRFNAAGSFDGYIGYCWDISERKHAEQAAEAHKERLRRGQLFANIGTWDWNIQSGELFWTERIAPLFGYPVAALDTSYDNFLAAIHPDDRQLVIDAVTACVERDAPYDIEHRVVWPDGTVRWLMERGAVVRDADGRALQMLGVVQDIDDRKRAEQALAERERQLREAQTMAHLGNWTANILTNELTWSDEIYRIFGHEPGSFTPSVEAFKATIHPDDRKRVRDSEKRAEQSGRHDVVHRIVRPDGRVRHVHELALAETDAAGKLVRLTGTVQDITERVEAETRLSETEERFAFAVEGAGDGIWDWDLRSNAMQFSRLYLEMLGYAENELPPHADTWIKSVHPDDMARIQQSLKDYLEGKSQAYNTELRLRCKNDSYKWILCRGTVVSRDNAGKPVRMIGIHSDISERKQVEQALIAARDEADRANQIKSEFLSSMSHELRTPMNAILGFGQLLQYDDTLSAEHKDSVGEIIKAGEHLLVLINEVLDLAKIESGRIDLSLEPVELCPIVNECMSLIGVLAQKRDIKLSHTGLKGSALRADRTRLRQALLNLLSNAVKYNRDGGNIHLEIKSQGTDRLRILVRDTGHGIPAERLAEVFQPFNRLDAQNGSIEGTGIGLTITRRIVEMMGGQVDVESELGVGSTFWIELPIEHISEQGEAMTTIADSAGQTQHAEEQHIVLYIEDNPSNLRLMAQILGRRKHIRLLTAHTPELGLELVLARRPDLILLDINMPGMDGYQVLNVLKGNANISSIPVIAVTANAMARDIENGLAAGFNDYVTKPIDIAKLFNILDRLLPNHKEV